MAVDIEFRPKMADVRKAIDDVRTEAAKPIDVAVNAAGGGGGGASGRTAAAGTNQVTASADAILGASAPAAVAAQAARTSAGMRGASERSYLAKYRAQVSLDAALMGNDPAALASMYTEAAQSFAPGSVQSIAYHTTAARYNNRANRDRAAGLERAGVAVGREQRSLSAAIDRLAAEERTARPLPNRPDVTPEGFWGGDPAPGDAFGDGDGPRRPPRSARAARRERRARMFPGWLGVGFAIHGAGTVAAAAQELGIEESLAVGVRGESNLMAQYQARQKFADRVASVPIVGQAASIALEYFTGSRGQTARTLQQAEFANQRMNLVELATDEMKSARDANYVNAGRGRYEQSIRAADANMRQSATAAEARRAEMIRSGASSVDVNRFDLGMRKAIWETYRRETADAEAEQSTTILDLQLGRAYNRLAATGTAGARMAGAMRLGRGYESRASRERDPRIAAAIRAEGASAVELYNTENERADANDIAGMAGATAANLFATARMPLMSRLQGEVNRREAELRSRGTLAAPGTQMHDAIMAQSASITTRIVQEDRDRKRYLGMDLMAERDALELAAENRPGAGRSRSGASRAIAGAIKLREQEGDPENANRLLGNAILEQQAMRKQIFESFQAREIDPATTALNGPRSGEDVTKLLAEIAANTRRLANNQTAEGGGAYTTD